MGVNNQLPDRRIRWEKDILTQLDDHVRKFDFPILDPDDYLLSNARLTAFKGTDEWLIIFERISFVYSQEWFVNDVYAYGNLLQKPGLRFAKTILEPSPEQPYRDDEANDLLDIWNFDAVIKGQVHHFSPSRKDYIQAGIDPEAAWPPELKMFRLLCRLMPGAFFLTNEQLLTGCGRPATLPKVLQLTEWWHPDVMKGELPSQNPCLESLARALAYNDPTLYICPMDKVNTHWSNWDSWVEGVYSKMHPAK